jgi:hypothetical protein
MRQRLHNMLRVLAHAMLTRTLSTAAEPLDVSQRYSWSARLAGGLSQRAQVSLAVEENAPRSPVPLLG